MGINQSVGRQRNVAYITSSRKISSIVICGIVYKEIRWSLRELKRDLLYC